MIVTPPEVRERWQRWVAFRQSMVLTLSITFGIIAATYAIPETTIPANAIAPNRTRPTIPVSSA